MTIRPIDLQVLIPKASEINRINHIQELQSQLQQQQFTAQFTEILQNRQKQVPGTADLKGQRMQLNKDSQGREGSSREQSGQEQRQPDNAGDDVCKYVNPNLGNHIDIKT